MENVNSDQFEHIMQIFNDNLTPLLHIYYK